LSRAQNSPPIVAESLAERVADRISSAIMRGDLALGERLGEQRWAEAFGVSRGPVREAALLLTARGHLVQHARRGFFVRSFTSEEIDSLYDMRLAVERHALLRILRDGDTTAIADSLARQVAQMKAALAKADVRQIAETDLAFHRLLTSKSGNPRLLKEFDELSTEILILISRLDLMRLDPEALVDSHLPLVDAVRQRDLDGALRETDFHIEDARLSMQRMLAELAEEET